MRAIQLSILPLIITLSTTSVKAQRNECSICPFGENVGFPDRIIPGRDRTCQEVSVLNIPEDSEECSQFRKSAAWCGCPSTPQECFLCEKGDSSPTPNERSPLFPDTTCSDYEFIASQLSAEECPSLEQKAGSFDISAYCQCKGTKAPKVCELCPGGVLVNPQGYSVVPGYTCEQVDEGLLQYFSDKSLCTEFRQVLLANNLCECIGSTDYPTKAPSIVTGEPTKAPKNKEPKPTDVPSPSPTGAPSKKPSKDDSTDLPSLSPTKQKPSKDDSKQSSTSLPSLSQPTPPTLSPTRLGPPPSSKGFVVPTPGQIPPPTIPTTPSITTSVPTRRSFKGSSTGNPSLSPMETSHSHGSTKGLIEVSSKSTKKESKKYGDKGVEKKLKTKKVESKHE